MVGNEEQTSHPLRNTTDDVQLTGDQSNDIHDESSHDQDIIVGDMCDRFEYTQMSREAINVSQQQETEDNSLTSDINSNTDFIEQQSPEPIPILTVEGKKESKESR